MKVRKKKLKKDWYKILAKKALESLLILTVIIIIQICLLVIAIAFIPEQEESEELKNCKENVRIAEQNLWKAENKEKEVINGGGQ